MSQKCYVQNRIGNLGPCTNEAVTLFGGKHPVCAECAKQFNDVLLPLMRSVRDDEGVLSKYTQQKINIPSSN